MANVVLARILGPTEFGRIGLIMFFVSISNVLIEGGLGGAIVRKKDATSSDYSTVFVFNLLISFFIAFVFVFFSSRIGHFFDDDELGALLSLSSTIILINAFQVTQNARLLRELKFKERSLFRFLAVLLGSCIGVFLAYLGYGVWSLVWLQISSAAFLLLFYSISQRFFLSFKFDFISFKRLYGFGINTTLATFINTAFDNLYQVILATYFSFEKVGFYYQAKKLQDVPNGIVNVFTQNVLFSTLAKLQDDKERFLSYYQRIQIFMIAILGMITIIIFSFSDQLVLIIFGTKWLESAHYMKILTWASLFFYAEVINKVIFKVFDRTRQLLYLEFVKKGFLSIFIAFGVFFRDIDLMLYGLGIANLFSYIINIFLTNRVIDQNLRLTFRNLGLTIFAMSLSVTAVQFLLTWMNLGGYLSILLLPVLGGFYVIALRILGVIDLISSSRQIIGKLGFNK